MATANPFDLLGDDDNDDPSQLIASQQQKIVAKKTPAVAPSVPAKLPSKPAPPSQAVMEARSNTAPARGGVGGSRGGLGRGRGGRRAAPGPNREMENGNANGYSGGYGGGGGEHGDTGKDLEREREAYVGPRPPYRGGRRGGYGNGEAGGDSERPPRRIYERRSGTGRGNDFKREGAGRGNWGTQTDDAPTQEKEEVVNTEDKIVPHEKEQGDVPASELNKEGTVNESEEKEPEDKEMTLEEYEKIREEKRKSLLALKLEERKVDLDKAFESMQQLSIKKGNDDIFIKLGSDKDSGKRKENADKDERVKKPVSITQFLKPAEGERYYSPGGRGRGRGRGDRGTFRGGFGGGGGASMVAAPSIEDPGQFPSLGRK